MVATAYMEEAARFDWLVAMDAGRVLATGSPKELLSRTGARIRSTRRSSRFCRKRNARATRTWSSRRARLRRRTRSPSKRRGLTQRFGDFVAVDHVSFRIARGEIFGFLGSNGCGKSTTMKMLTGLLPPTEGTATLFGAKMDANDIELRRRVGYMSQAFSLYTELTVRQNLDLHARLFRLPPEKIERASHEVAERFDLTDGHGGVARRAAVGHSSAPLARRGDDPFPRDADPGRADVGSRSGRARRVLANPRRSFPQG